MFFLGVLLEFFFLGVIFLFITVFLFNCLIASFNNNNNYFLAHKFVPLIIKAKCIAVG